MNPSNQPDPSSDKPTKSVATGIILSKKPEPTLFGQKLFVTALQYRRSQRRRLCFKHRVVRVEYSSAAHSPYNKTSDVFSPEYKANTSRRIGFSADVITNTSSNIRLYTAFAMNIVGICPKLRNLRY